MTGPARAARGAALCALCALAVSAAAQEWEGRGAGDSIPPVNYLAIRGTAGVSVGVAGVSAPDVVQFMNWMLATDAVTVNTFATAALLGAHGWWRVGDDFALGARYALASMSYAFGGGDPYATTSFSYDLQSFDATIDRLLIDTTTVAGFGVSGGLLAAVFRQTPQGSTRTEHDRALGGDVGLHAFLLTPLSQHVLLRTQLEGYLTFTGALRRPDGSTLTAVRDGRLAPVTLGATVGAVSVGVVYAF